MLDIIRDTVERLRRRDEVNDAYATVEAWAKAGKVRALMALASTLEAECDATGAARAPWEDLVDHVEEQLALSPGDDRVDAVLQLLEQPRARTVERPRSRELRTRAFASRLGHGQPKEALSAALSRAGDRPELEPLFACWMHEIVLRGTSLEGDEPAVRLAAALAEKGDPLGSMPLSLLPAEREAPSYMPMYGAGAIQQAVARLESGPTSTRTIPPPFDASAPRAVALDDEAFGARVREAVRPWLDGANGRAEAASFVLAPPLKAGTAGTWLLRALALPWLASAKKIEATRAFADAVWGALFAASANGGAYSAGLGGAHGRRAAWTTLAALVDAPPDAPPAEVDALAQRSAFLMFGADAFFHDVAWDLGVLAVRPDGASAAVLAATDAD